MLVRRPLTIRGLPARTVGTLFILTADGSAARRARVGRE